MSPGVRRPLSSALGAGISLAVACGGAGFDGRVFRNDELSFRVDAVPPGWRAIEATGALVAFRDDATPASIAVGGRCNRDGDDVPLGALTHHLFLQFTDRKIESQIEVALDGRSALHTDLAARLDGVEKRFSVFVFKKNGCVYDFVHVAPPGAPTEGRRRFVAFVESFSTLAP